jgi:CRISPR system Cascade subunit CasE
MTLYLSRLRLNPRNRTAAANLSRPYEMHRTLLRAFPSADQGGPGRVLFRSEPVLQARAREATVLVQSETEPDWIQADEAFPTGLLLAPPEFRSLPTTFEIGTVLRFRLRANPTVRRSKLPDGTRDERRQHPRHALYRQEDQLAWLLRQGGSQGFELVASNATDWFDTEALCARYDVIVRNEGTMLTGKKTKTGVTRHHSVLFDGRLRVTDAPAFRMALRCGIGPAKAFGFGLLSVAPVRP